MSDLQAHEPFRGEIWGCLLEEQSLTFRDRLRVVLEGWALDPWEVAMTHRLQRAPGLVADVGWEAG